MIATRPKRLLLFVKKCNVSEERWGAEFEAGQVRSEMKLSSLSNQKKKAFAYFSYDLASSSQQEGSCIRLNIPALQDNN
ncbi:MAG: hypothetical protein D3904_02140 [Candidatus Electrothrix sp. EH2]|nr:hypothetical protein [Candidatus Electrothrix sp. EH2]